MENTHIVKSFDRDLAQIDNLILEMGGMVENQILLSINALIARDEQLAMTVRAADKPIDRLESAIDEASIRVLTLRQPLATDLRRGRQKPINFKLAPKWPWAIQVAPSLRRMALSLAWCSKNSTRKPLPKEPKIFWST